MKNILITGANGQLGNEMRMLAVQHPEYAYFFTDVEELDICDEQAVMDFVQSNAIDCIVNCAAYTAVDKAEENVELCDKLNRLAPGYLAKAAASRGAALIQVSTDYVIDRTNHIGRPNLLVPILCMDVPNWPVSKRQSAFASAR